MNKNLRKVSEISSVLRKLIALEISSRSSPNRWWLNLIIDSINMVFMWSKLMLWMWLFQEILELPFNKPQLMMYFYKTKLGFKKMSNSDWWMKKIRKYRLLREKIKRSCFSYKTRLQWRKSDYRNSKCRQRQINKSGLFKHFKISKSKSFKLKSWKIWPSKELKKRRKIY